MCGPNASLVVSGSGVEPASTHLQVCGQIQITVRSTQPARLQTTQPTRPDESLRYACRRLREYELVWNLPRGPAEIRTPAFHTASVVALGGPTVFLHVLGEVSAHIVHLSDC